MKNIFYFTIRNTTLLSVHKQKQLRHDGSTPIFLQILYNLSYIQTDYYVSNSHDSIGIHRKDSTGFHRKDSKGFHRKDSKEHSKSKSKKKDKRKNSTQETTKD